MKLLGGNPVKVTPLLPRIGRIPPKQGVEPGKASEKLPVTIESLDTLTETYALSFVSRS